MSRVSEVLKNKNAVERSQKARRKEELNSLNMAAAFKASLMNEMNKLNVILNDENVECVTIKIPEEHITQFNKAIYSEEMAGYEITQIEPDTFEIRYRMI